MTTWFTADTHFGHGRCIDLNKRPFRDAKHMNQEIVLRWNAIVRPDDEVWHLGDFAHKGEPTEAARIFARLNGKKHLVVGNHDHTETLDLGWASVQDVARVVVRAGGHARREGEVHDVWLSHYPHLEWPRSHRGAVHLFGHVHGNTEGVGRSADVGVDVWDYRPVTLDEILMRIGGRA